MTTNPLLWVIPALPLAGFFLNAFLGSTMNKKLSGGLATVLVWAAFVASLMLFQQVQQATEHQVFSPSIEWIPQIHLKLELVADPLSALMLLVITGVGALIHGYSMGYMSHEKNYSRYFTYLNLFIFFMLLLVLGANLVMMFVGWEGVGLASYLLIGFWQEKKSATDAGKKAFVVNRIGDAALLLALFGLYWAFGTLDFFGTEGILGKVSAMAGSPTEPYSAIALMVPLLLFVGATGKSAQFPLYVWLPDAMEGPTPVSALIHAATMVTAGVYLLTRTSALFLIAPTAMAVVTVIGLFTAVLAASIALAQNDIKKILALLDRLPARIHVPCLRRRRVHRSDVPCRHACLLQGASVPRVGLRHPCDERRAGRPQDGRSLEEAADHGLDHGDRHRGDLGGSATGRVLV